MAYFYYIHTSLPSVERLLSRDDSLTEGLMVALDDGTPSGIADSRKGIMRFVQVESSSISDKVVDGRSLGQRHWIKYYDIGRDGSFGGIFPASSRDTGFYFLSGERFVSTAYGHKRYNYYIDKVGAASIARGDYIGIYEDIGFCDASLYKIDGVAQFSRVENIYERISADGSAQRVVCCLVASKRLESGDAEKRWFEYNVDDVFYCLRVVSCEITKRMEVDFEESHDVYLPNKK